MGKLAMPLYLPCGRDCKGKIVSQYPCHLEQVRGLTLPPSLLPTAVHGKVGPVPLGRSDPTPLLPYEQRRNAPTPVHLWWFGKQALRS